MEESLWAKRGARGDCGEASGAVDGRGARGRPGIGVTGPLLDRKVEARGVEVVLADAFAMVG